MKRIGVTTVTGFLGAGKSTWLRKEISHMLESGRRVALLLCENGKTKLEEMEDPRLVIFRVRRPEALREALLNCVTEAFAADWVFIEYNGTWPVAAVAELFSERDISRGFDEKNGMHLVRGATLAAGLQNLGSMYRTPLAMAETVCVADMHRLPPDTQEAVFQEIRQVTPGATVVFQEHDAGPLVSYRRVRLRRQPWMKPANLLGVLFFLLVFCYLGSQLVQGMRQGYLQTDFSGLRQMHTAVTGIVLQAMPFILLGSLVSALMHALIPEDRLAAWLPQQRLRSYVAALLGGVLLPVCECGIVPVAGRLVKKGVAPPVAVTFMLAAPMVNPVVVAATLSAFPGNAAMAVLRVAGGLLVALAVGLSLALTGETGGVLAETPEEIRCGCALCNARGDGGPLLARILSHTLSEWLKTTAYLIAGAAVAVTVRGFLPAGTGIPGGSMLAGMGLMMLMAFVFSVCATSDAFIARSFQSTFGNGPVLGFLVFGPMLDIKNVIMMRSVFTGRFTMNLVVRVVVFSMAVIGVLALLAGGGR